MSLVEQLKAATNLTAVANLLGFKPAALSYILYKKTPDSNYKKFEIPKRYGGTRLISAPEPQLKLVQTRLAALLQNCIDEVNTANKYRDSIAHGFKRKRSIITNAKRHRRRRFVFNIDLQDFFASINFGRVRGYFIKDKNFSLDKNVATILAKIACFENGLPQGSPCSPIISNLIGHVLDIHLARLAAYAGCTYTRYADDLTFSTNKQMFPEEIAVRTESDPHAWTPADELMRIVQKNGFNINATKTRMQYRNCRQEVTGLIVNQKLNIRQEYRHTTRAMVHRLISTGRFELIRRIVDAQGEEKTIAIPGTSNQLHGMLGFIDRLDRYNRELDKKRAMEQKKKFDESKLSNKELIYRRFLHFTYLYAAPRPVIICEGSTDNIYLLHAIRSLAVSFPTLVTMDADGMIKLAVRLLRYAETGTGRILGIASGGSGNLVKLIWDYLEEKKRFRAPGLTQPVVIVVDNDSGAQSVFDAVGKITKAKPEKTEPFLHITGNLYLVPTPGTPGVSKIEDCFDEATKATVIDGKTFDTGNSIDTSSHYGKKIFAHRVVAKRADKIDFSGFAPLLERIASAIAAHQEKNITDKAVRGLMP